VQADTGGWDEAASDTLSSADTRNGATGDNTDDATDTDDPSHMVTEFPVSKPSSKPWLIVAGPDGNLCFTEARSNRIGRITPD